MGAGIAPAPRFLHCRCCAAVAARELMIFILSCDAQAYNPMDEAGRLQTFIDEFVNVSESSWRLAPRARELATARPRCSVWQQACVFSSCTGVPWPVWSCTMAGCSASVPLVDIQVSFGAQHTCYGSRAA